MPLACLLLLHRSTRGVRLAAAALGLVMGLGLVPGMAAAAEIKRVGDVVEVRGDLIGGDGARFTALLNDSVQLVRISSAGGDLGAALEIASAMRTRELALSVDGLCGEVCVQFILPAATGLSIAERSLVVMQGGSHGLWRAALREGALRADGYAATRQYTEQVDAVVNAHARQLGLKAEAIDFMYGITAGTQVRLSLVNVDGGAPQVRLDGSSAPYCSGWLLDPASLRALGVDSHEWEPPNVLLATARLGVAIGSLYVGPPLAPEDVATARNCGDLRTLRDSRATKR